MAGLIGAFGCSSSDRSETDEDDASGGSYARGGSGPQGGTGPTCTPRRPCTCPLGKTNGVTECLEDGGQACICEDCPAFEAPEAPSIEACGGEPFGTWRLAGVEFGRTDLEISRDGMLLGSCDALIEFTNMPVLLIELADGGNGTIYAESPQFTQSWSNSCVVSLASELSCGNIEFEGNRTCTLDCDVCGCRGSNPERINESITWSRTTTSLSLELWTGPGTFDYCITDDSLELATTGAHMVFERVNTFSQPVPCSERTLEQCLLGSGCRVGTCLGEMGCETRTSESTCLTMQGCSWDASVCSGTGQSGCRLGDYGVVPGCDFVDRPQRCVGTPDTCDAQTDVTCADIAGCELSDVGRCTGGSADCATLIACPVDYCSYSAGTCSGTAHCRSRTVQTSCERLNYDASDPDLCTWIDYSCAGTATPCEDLTPEECGSQPGCSVEPIPE
jgi:hypothetical protein